MTDHDALAELSRLRDEIKRVEALCCRVIEEDFGDLIRHMPAPLQTPEGWFDLLAGIPMVPAKIETLRRLTEDAKCAGNWSRGAIERFGALEASRVALPRLASLPVDESVNWQFCDLVRRVASTAQGWGNYFDYDSDAFEEVARIVTLRRFHAGQLSFDVMAMPRTWLLKVHPLALPGVLRELFYEAGGRGPMVMPHVNYWRSNPMMMLKEEHELSMWRIARSIELQPRIKGLVASSWLYSIEVGEVSPHLAWLRDFYQDNGAYITDMEPAPERAGFMVGSKFRRRLYLEGKFRPRQTLVLWPRASMLAWARGGLKQAGNPQSPSRVKIPAGPSWKSNANRTLSSGQLTIINCERMSTESPRPYFFIVFILPCLLIALAAGLALGIAAVIPALILGLVGIWLFQYFFLQ
jgi:hypothetical protein